MNEHFLDAEILFPDSDSIHNGKLRIAKEKSQLLFNTNPFGLFDTRSIRVAYITLNKSKTLYSAVQCYWSSQDENGVIYGIEELYKGAFIGDNKDETFNKLTAQVSYLTSWLNPMLFNFNSNEDEMSFTAKHKKDFLFKLEGGISIEFRAYLSGSLNRNHYAFRQRSQVFIRSDANRSKSDLSDIFLSFLTFYNLFLPKLPITFNLQFVSAETVIELISLPDYDDKVEKANDLMVKLEEMPHFEIMLQNYYNHRKDLDRVVDLWSACLKGWDSEIVFLHLTQALESFHRDIFEPNPKPDITIVQETKQLFKNRVRNAEWTQIMRYYHLLKVTMLKNQSIIFPTNTSLFLEELTDSRNTYTHHQSKSKAWNKFELYEANRILRQWIRYLVLEFIGLPSPMNKYIAGREAFMKEDLNIFENPYSMRFKHYRY